MKKSNDRWYDENNNSWDAAIETKDSALAKSKRLIDCRGCSYCSDCRGCSYCSYCSYCSDYQSNPQRYITPKVGSRNSQTSIYWTTKEDVQIFCGCWRGDIVKFEERVKKVHGESIHLQPYLKQIELFKMLVNQ